MITCHLLYSSTWAHLSQLFTGFSLLHSAGEILLSQEYKAQSLFDAAKPQHLRDARRTHLLVVVNHSIRLYYDCHDSCEIDEQAAGEVDYYFKRSYAPAQVPDSCKDKVFPLGLNYGVFPAESDSFERRRRSMLEQSAPPPSVPSSRPALEMMYSPPDLRATRVLFMTRAWDPHDAPDRPKEKIAERMLINETRARCIELLRDRFGSGFLGGFAHTDYAARNYGSALLQDREASGKENYIKLLRGHAVCVATTGLHGSIGWKMGEYVAFSKAIVSEKLNYQVPGDFKAGKNYLEFSEPEQCVEAVAELLSNAHLRHGMMKANHLYYLTFLKPDRMIKRTLDLALSIKPDSAER